MRPRGVAWEITSETSQAAHRISFRKLRKTQDGLPGEV
jgi:hypothetical protein